MNFIAPAWPCPPSVRSVQTTRHGGVSQPPFDSLNLATHVGDDPACVQANRARLHQQLALPSEPLWLEQVHGVDVYHALGDTPTTPPRADAAYSNQPGRVLAVLTADCLPVLFCAHNGTEVAVAHAGWRGLCAGVLEATLAAFQSPPSAIMAWLGPAIGQAAFEVGEEVRAAFLSQDPHAAVAFMPSNRPEHWQADLYMLARQRLALAGVNLVYGGGDCTFSDATRFFSYRRSTPCGRMASLIWLQP